MQEAQTAVETNGKCCAKKGRHRHQRPEDCGGSRKQEAGGAGLSALEILGQRFARGELDGAEYEEKRRLIVNA